jgi:hypothetical protein
MQLCCLIQCYRTEINSPTNFISIHDQSEMFHFDFRPMRDVLFRLATNEMCFISIHDQWDTFYFDTRPIRDVLFRFLTNQGCFLSRFPTNERRFISMRDQWDVLFRFATNERCFISIREQIIIIEHSCSFPLSLCYLQIYYNICMGCRGRDRIVVGFSTTCVISAYHH